MSQQESENYNTIHTKPTYRSPIIRNRTIYKHEPSNIRQENIQDKQIQNKIDKTFTKINPVNNIYSNIQKNRERSQITELKEQNEQKQKNKLKKNLSSYDIFVPKDSKKYNPSSKHFTFNDMKKKKRNSSVASIKKPNYSQKDFECVCNNCYNNKIVTRSFKEHPPEKKEILNRTFNKLNPFYFQDKMKYLYKDKIQNKVKELEKIQRQALTHLAKYEIDNPSNIEIFQKQQELSANPMLAHEREDPRIKKTLRAYDLKENFINENRDIYQVNKPRKAINDYYKKCCFQIPIMENEYFVEPKYIKQVSIDLRDQIEEKKINKKKIKDEEIKTERIANKKIVDYSQFICRKNKAQRKNYLDQFYKKSKVVENFKKIKEEQQQKNRKDYLDKIEQKMKREDEEKKNKFYRKKVDEYNRIQNWKKNVEKDKKYKKLEREEENHKWMNYSQDYIIKCNHGITEAKCSLCDRPMLKEKIFRISQRSNDISSVSSKDATSLVVEKV